MELGDDDGVVLFKGYPKGVPVSGVSFSSLQEFDAKDPDSNVQLLNPPATLTCRVYLASGGSEADAQNAKATVIEAAEHNAAVGVHEQTTLLLLRHVDAATDSHPLSCMWRALSIADLLISPVEKDDDNDDGSEKKCESTTQDSEPRYQFSVFFGDYFVKFTPITAGDAGRKTLAYLHRQLFSYYFKAKQSVIERQRSSLATKRVAVRKLRAVADDIAANLDSDDRNVVTADGRRRSKRRSKRSGRRSKRHSKRRPQTAPQQGRTTTGSEPTYVDLTSLKEVRHTYPDGSKSLSSSVNTHLPPSQQVDDTSAHNSGVDRSPMPAPRSLPTSPRGPIGRLPTLANPLATSTNDADMQKSPLPSPLPSSLSPSPLSPSPRRTLATPPHPPPRPRHTFKGTAEHAQRSGESIYDDIGKGRRSPKTQLDDVQRPSKGRTSSRAAKTSETLAKETTQDAVDQELPAVPPRDASGNDPNDVTVYEEPQPDPDAAKDAHGDGRNASAANFPTQTAVPDQRLSGVYKQHAHINSSTGDDASRVRGLFSADAARAMQLIDDNDASHLFSSEGGPSGRENESDTDDDSVSGSESNGNSRRPSSLLGATYQSQGSNSSLGRTQLNASDIVAVTRNSMCTGASEDPDENASPREGRRVSAYGITAAMKQRTFALPMVPIERDMGSSMNSTLPSLKASTATLNTRGVSTISLFSDVQEIAELRSEIACKHPDSSERIARAEALSDIDSDSDADSDAFADDIDHAQIDNNAEGEKMVVGDRARKSTSSGLIGLDGGYIGIIVDDADAGKGQHATRKVAVPDNDFYGFGRTPTPTPPATAHTPSQQQQQHEGDADSRGGRMTPAGFGFDGSARDEDQSKEDDYDNAKNLRHTRGAADNDNDDDDDDDAYAYRGDVVPGVDRRSSELSVLQRRWSVDSQGDHVYDYGRETAALPNSGTFLASSRRSLRLHEYDNFDAIANSTGGSTITHNRETPVPPNTTGANFIRAILSPFLRKGQRHRHQKHGNGDGDGEGGDTQQGSESEGEDESGSGSSSEDEDEAAMVYKHEGDGQVVTNSDAQDPSDPQNRPNGYVSTTADEGARIDDSDAPGRKEEAQDPEDAFLVTDDDAPEMILRFHNGQLVLMSGTYQNLLNYLTTTHVKGQIFQQVALSQPSPYKQPSKAAATERSDGQKTPSKISAQRHQEGNYFFSSHPPLPVAQEAVGESALRNADSSNGVAILADIPPKPLISPPSQPSMITLPLPRGPSSTSINSSTVPSPVRSSPRSASVLPGTGTASTHTPPTPPSPLVISTSPPPSPHEAAPSPSGKKQKSFGLRVLHRLTSPTRRSHKKREKEKEEKEKSKENAKSIKRVKMKEKSVKSKKKQSKLASEKAPQSLKVTVPSSTSATTATASTQSVASQQSANSLATPNTPSRIHAIFGKRVGTQSVLTETRDTEYQSIFLLTFRLFMSPRQLLAALQQRFDAPDLFYSVQELTERELVILQQNNHLSRRKIVGVVLEWMARFWQDFARDATLKRDLKAFIDTLRLSGFESLYERCTAVFEKQSIHEASDSTHALLPLLPSIPSDGSKQTEDSSDAYENTDGILDAPANIDLLSAKPSKIAEQVTMFNHGLLRDIAPVEFVNHLRKKKDAADDASYDTYTPHLARFIKRFDEESYWVAAEVLKHNDVKLRAKMVEKFVAVVKKCVKFSNFFSVYAIMGGLSFPEVKYEKDVWKKVSKRTLKYIVQLEEGLLDPSRNMANYRRAIAEIDLRTTPAIPFLPVTLKDLLFWDEGNSDNVDEMLNFDKLRRLAEHVKEIGEQTDLEYEFACDAQLQAYIAQNAVEERKRPPRK